MRTHVCGACCNNPQVWRDLGIELLGQEGESDLNMIAANSGGNVIQCCSSMFSLWLERQPEASWRQLFKALSNVNLVSLATETERLLTPSEQHQSSQQTLTNLQGTSINRRTTMFMWEGHVLVLLHMRILIPYTYGMSHMHILIWNTHTCMRLHLVPYKYFICMFLFLYRFLDTACCY